jgi:hypothetical protein
MLSLTAGWMCACDRTDPVTQPAPVPVDAEPATPASSHSTTPTSLPTRTYIAIGGEPHAFPPARLRVTQNDDSVTALLYSDDPPEAVQDHYKGNSFYLQMSLDISDPADLHTTTWRYKAPNSERNDTPSGIFLEGSAIQLQPFDVFVEFTPEDNLLVITLTGEFLQFTATQPQNPGQMRTVAGQILTRVEIR